MEQNEHIVDMYGDFQVMIFKTLNNNDAYEDFTKRNRPYKEV